MNTYRIKGSRRRHPVREILGRDKGPINKLSAAEFFKLFSGARSDHPGRKS